MLANHWLNRQLRFPRFGTPGAFSAPALVFGPARGTPQHFNSLRTLGFSTYVQEVAMKRLVLLALLALALPLSAFADTWDFTNISGNLTGNNAGLTLTGSSVINIDGPGGPFVCPCTESFSLGAFAGGPGNAGNSLRLPGTFSGVGSAFTITLNGGGVIFNGSFTSPATWTPEGNGIFQLSGYVSGTLTLPNGQTRTVKGFTSQLYFGTVNAAGVFTGTLGSGDTIVSTPEPGTLALFGTGLVGLAGIVRRKLKT
jgi:hypothetical protein